MKKLPYEEGDWFAVPLRDRGYAVGLVARRPKNARVLLGYFFGPRRDDVPSLDEVSSLSPEQAVSALRFGDLSLVNNEWPVIGRSPSWDRLRWPMPTFVRTEPLRGITWKVHYPNDNPRGNPTLERVKGNLADFEKDGLYGAGAVEIHLTEILNK